MTITKVFKIISFAFLILGVSWVFDCPLGWATFIEDGGNYDEHTASSKISTLEEQMIPRFEEIDWNNDGFRFVSIRIKDSKTFLNSYKDGLYRGLQAENDATLESIIEKTMKLSKQNANPLDYLLTLQLYPTVMQYTGDQEQIITVIERRGKKETPTSYTFTKGTKIPFVLEIPKPLKEISPQSTLTAFPGFVFYNGTNVLKLGEIQYNYKGTQFGLETRLKIFN